MVKRAFTTVELLAATVLAAMLLSAVLGVVGSLARQQKVLLSRRPVEPWRVQLRKRLGWDLKHSQSYQFDGKSLTLTGLASRDFASATPTYQRAVIEYQFRNDVLIRRETHPQSLSNANVNAEVVLVGAGRLMISASSEPQQGPIPNRTAISIYNSKDKIVFAHAFMLR